MLKKIKRNMIRIYIKLSFIHLLILLIVLSKFIAKKKNFIYDIVANKFFQKLNTTFSNDEIINRIKILEDKKIVFDKENKN